LKIRLRQRGGSSDTLPRNGVVVIIIVGIGDIRSNSRIASSLPGADALPSRRTQRGRCKLMNKSRRARRGGTRRRTRLKETGKKATRSGIALELEKLRTVRNEMIHGTAKEAGASGAGRKSGKKEIFIR
jgi:hypothetical protein